MSWQTTQARFDARQAERAWKDHQLGCPQCSRAYRSRRTDDICGPGAELRRAWGHALRELARNREEDRKPITGQDVLF
jgi:hypothetical protein